MHDLLGDEEAAEIQVATNVEPDRDEDTASDETYCSSEEEEGRDAAVLLDDNAFDAEGKCSPLQRVSSAVGLNGSDQQGIYYEVAVGIRPAIELCRCCKM